MSAARIVLGLASIALGAKHLTSGVQALSGGPRPMPRPAPRRLAAPAPQRVQAGGQGRMTVYSVRSIDDRIRHLRERVQKGKTDPRVYTFARKVLNQKCGGNWCIPEKDNLREMQALYDAVRKNVRYTSDILGVDTYQHPTRTLELAGGDCDDFSSLMCSLLLSAGIPCRFKVIRTKGSREWNHIYAQGGLPRANPTKWITLDASVNMPFGWEAPSHMVAESRVFSVR